MTDGPSKGELILYRTEDGRAVIRLRAVGGTVWLTQAEIAALFDTSNVSLHLKNIFEGNVGPCISSQEILDNCRRRHSDRRAVRQCYANITQHLRRIYADRELDEAATCKDLLQVREDVEDRDA